MDKNTPKSNKVVHEISVLRKKGNTRREIIFTPVPNTTDIRKLPGLKPGDKGWKRVSKKPQATPNTNRVGDKVFGKPDDEDNKRLTLAIEASLASICLADSKAAEDLQYAEYHKDLRKVCKEYGCTIFVKTPGSSLCPEHQLVEDERYARKLRNDEFKKLDNF
jgi:hypothetical protein